MKTALSRMVGRARMLGAWPPERQFGLGFASKPLINYANWRLVLRNRYDVEVIVDQNFDLVSAQQLTQPRK